MSSSFYRIIWAFKYFTTIIIVLISKSHQCQFCYEVLETFAQLNSHLSRHSIEKRFKCPDKKCSQLFSDIESYINHTQLTHQIKLKYACSKCHQSFVTKSRLSLHEYAHTLKVQEKIVEIDQIDPNIPYVEKGWKKVRLECLKCNTTFTSQKSYDKHMNFVNHDIQCPICHQKFASDVVIRKHLRTHTKRTLANNNSIKCNVCDKSFKSEFYLKSHKLIHTGDLPFGCDKCSAKFNRKDKLKRHSLLHGTGMKYPCPFQENTKCKKVFYRMDKLKSHIQTHGNTKRRKCSHCQQMFSNSTLLRNHISASHDFSSKKIKCFECEETFKLEKQRRIHHESKHGIIHYLDGTSVKSRLPVSNSDPLSKIKNSSTLNIDESQQDNIIIYIEAD
jgi:hypothetical protein